MKIGIVTVQDSNNFGSFLQAYALQTVLQSMGHDVVFIRSRSIEYLKGIFYHIRPGKKDLLHMYSFIVSNWRGWRKYKKFQLEQRRFRVIDNYKDETLDLVILGSDEIWNVQTSVFRHSIFYGKDMTPVMAYAVSIGSSEVEDMACIPNSWFYNISPILSRDIHTSKFLKTLQIDSPVVCDPTLLVDKSIFERNFYDSLMSGRPYILVYSYGLDMKYVKLIRSFAQKRNLKVLSVCFPFDWCDGVIDCAALDFCAVLKRAAYVFTSTYHGTIFSVLNHKQFISLPQSRKTRDFLCQFELSDRLVKEEMTEAQLETKFDVQIDYISIDEKIDKIRKYSLELLHKGIACYVR